MKINFTPNRQKTIVILCILLVAVLAIMYLFVYIPANENYLNSRRFQAIQRIESNIHKKQDNTLKLIEQLVNAYATDSVDNNALRKYIESSFSDISKLKFDRLIPVKKLKGKQDKEVIEPDAKYSTNAEIENGILLFYSTRDDDNSTVTLALKASATGFFKPLLPETIFDEYVVVVDSNIAYESFATGLNGSNYDSLIYINRNLKGANTRPLNLSGIQYQAYIQPFSMANKENGFVMGLLKDTTYQAERSYIPAGIVIIVIFVLIIVLILLPWIKLFSLGMRDRLTLMDGALSFMVAMLLVSIAFLAFAHIGIRYQQPNPLNGMKDLAAKLEKRSTDVLIQMQNKLNRYDSLYAQNINLQNCIQSFHKPELIHIGNIYDINDKNRIFPDSLKPFFKEIYNKNINQIFWLDDKSGNEVANWGASSYNAPLGKYDTRGYFLNQRDNLEPYTLEPLISWTTGTFRTVMSTKSKKNGQIVCLSFSLQPMKDPILPKGYSFAFVNSQGEVLYHSNSRNNLNENLPNECDNSFEVLGAIQSRKATTLSALYRGVQSEMFIRPASLNGYKCWVVVISSNDFQIVKETGAISFTLLMLLLFFILVSIQLMVVVWFGSRNSLLRAFRMETDWIWPRPSSRTVYQYAGYYNFLLLAWLIFLYKYAGFLLFFFMLLIAGSFITMFINFLYNFKYKAAGNGRLQFYKKRNILALAVFLLLLNVIAIKQLWHGKHDVIVLIIFETGACLIGTAILAYFKVKNYNQLIKHYASGENLNILSETRGKFIHSYAFMSITRLIVTSGLPVFFFYQQAYNYQQSIQTHYRHLQFSAQVAVKDTIADPKFFDRGNAFTDGYYIKSVVEQNSSPDGSSYTGVDSLSSDILSRFRIYDTRLSNELDATAFNRSDDNSYFFTPPLGSPNVDLGNRTFIERKGKSSIVISSDKINYKFPQFFNWDNYSLIYWIALFLVLFFLYRLIIQVVSRLFALDVPGETMLEPLIEELLNFKDGSRLSFVAGLPGSRKMKLILKYTSPKDREIIDLFYFPENENWKQADTIILNHFEYVVSSPDSYKSAITLLEKLLLAEGKPAIIILSTIHLSGLMRQVEQLFEDKGKLEIALNMDKLRIILGHFNLIVIPILRHEAEMLNKIDTENGSLLPPIKVVSELDGWMKDEFAISPFIHRLKAPMFHSKSQGKGTDSDVAYNPSDNSIKSKIKLMLRWFDDSDAMEGDKVVWRLQNIASQFYDHIWQSLSPEERYLVYDLAEEGLVNQADTYHLSMLIQKGLIRRKEPNGQLELMNYSFRNFILTSVDKEEALALQNQLSGSSTWSELRTPLVLVVVGIMAILLVSQQQTFSSIFGYLTAIAALIPTLNALFGLIKPGGSTSK